MEVDLYKYETYVMQLLKDIQDPLKVKSVSDEFDKIPVKEVVAPLIKTIQRQSFNPEEHDIASNRTQAQSAAITLKNVLFHRHKLSVYNFFDKDQDIAIELLKEVVGSIIALNDELIVPHLALVVVNILKGIKAEGDTVVECINEIFKKVTDNIGNYQIMRLGLEGVYEIIKEFTKSKDVLDKLSNSSYLWIKDFKQLNDEVADILKQKLCTDESTQLKGIYILMIRILMKVVTCIEKDDLLEFVYFIKSGKERNFKLILDSASQLTSDVNEENLKVINYLHTIEIYVSDFLAIEKRDLDFYMDIAEYYGSLAFNQDTLSKIKSSFLGQSESRCIESDCYELAELLSQSIHFHNTILNCPSYWVNDILFEDSDVDTVSKIEKKLREYYDEKKISDMVETVIKNYLPLTNEDLENWREDPVDFYFKNKEMDYESIPLLRESSIAFIKAVELRFPEYLSKLAGTIKETIRSSLGQSSITQEESIMKEAFYHFLQHSIEITEEDKDDFFTIVKQEFENLDPNDKIIKRRLIIILSTIADNFKNKDKKVIVEILNAVVQIMIVEQDPLLKLTCVYFGKDFYDDYYLERDTYSGSVQHIFKCSGEFVNSLKETNNHQAIDECLGLINILTQKYLEVAKECLHNFTFFDSDLIKFNRAMIQSITIQAMSLLEDNDFNQDITQFGSKLIIDSLYCSDIFANENALKMLLIYCRRLQNYEDESNPFLITIDLFSTLSKIATHLERAEVDDMLNIFGILEEVHFCIDKVGIVDKSDNQQILDVYKEVFRCMESYADTFENSYISLLGAYLASTLVVTNSGQDLLEVVCSVMDTLKTLILDKLYYKNEEVEEYHQNLINGYMTLFCSICLVQPQIGINIDDSTSEHEQNFIKLLTKLGEGFMANSENMFNAENTEDDDDDDSTENKNLPILFSVVYGVYYQFINQKHLDLSRLLDQSIYEKCKTLLKQVLDVKSETLGDSPRIFICDGLKSLTSEADISLLFEVHSKKRIIGKNKKKLILSTAEKEQQLFIELIR